MSSPDSPLPPTNNNPTGINQYKNCRLWPIASVNHPSRLTLSYSAASSTDEQVESIIRDYDHQGICNHNLVSEMLLSEHGLEMSAMTIARRRKAYGLQGSGATTQSLPAATKRQLVLDQLLKDPASRQRLLTIKEAVLFDTGISLTRPVHTIHVSYVYSHQALCSSYIRSEMHLQDLDGFSIREPSAKKVKRGVLVALGLHHEWSGDGYDKLAAIGFPVWGVRDKWSGKWLGLWVLPNNRLKDAIAFLYLLLIKEYGGMPLQSTTDCGSETTTVFGLANALREVFSPTISLEEIPTHRFLQSIHNITIERGWLRFRLQFGDNVKVFWNAGEGLHNNANPDHHNLVQWLWSTLIQAELDMLRTKFNDHHVRTDCSKQLPSGTSPNIAMAMPWKFQGEDCLQRVDVNIVSELMDMIGDEALQFVTPEYANLARGVFQSLGVEKLTFLNIWQVFTAMLPLMLEV